MAMRSVDLTGQKFGYLTAIRRAGTSKCGRAMWVCRCDCGTEVERLSQYLRAAAREHPRSCGCRHGNTQHGMTNSRPFRIWGNMKDRCLNPNAKDYKNYGGRGITVCAEWAASFEAFWRDMQGGYADNLSLDRKDNSGPYSPENCHWATQLEQHNNKRSNTWIDAPEGRVTISQAARARGMQPQTLCARLYRYGWPLAKALNTPVRTTS